MRPHFSFMILMFMLIRTAIPVKAGDTTSLHLRNNRFRGPGFHSQAPLPPFDNGRFFKGISTGLHFNFNRDDLLLGPSLGIQTTKLNMSLCAGIMARPHTKSVYYTGCYPGYSSYTCKLNERVILCYVYLEKRLGININLSNTGIFGGVKVMETLIRYNNYTDHPDGMTIITPMGGLYWMSHEMLIKVGYEYMDLKMDDNPYYPNVHWPDMFQHRLVVSLIYSFNFLPNVGF
ncbi:MAG: hypothetical protein KJ607_11530 [Bacteroidetes bacterium]|nr:hypothetical protein [Bacteroidota bacterium]